MYSHHSSILPERHPSDHETSSDTKTYKAEEYLESLAARQALLTDDGLHAYHSTTCASPPFPSHLLSACSASGRVMCQYSRSVTTHEVRSVLGLRGTYMYVDRRGMHVWCGVDKPPRRKAGAAGPWLALPSSLFRANGGTLSTPHATMQEPLP